MTLSMGIRTGVTSVALCVVPVHASHAQDNWKNLSKVSKKTLLEFVLKDGSCKSGHIIKWDLSQLLLSVDKPQPIVIRLADLLEAGENPRPHDLVFTSRSSWKNVIAASPGHAERLEVLVKNGQRYSGKPLSVSDGAIEMESSTGRRMIVKQDVSTVDYIRQKPLTDGELYIEQEAPFLLMFSPETYVRMSGISSKLSVRLYDATLPEQNDSIVCK